MPDPIKPVQPSPPRIVLSLGLFRSASTWAFNVIADIGRLGGPVRTLYADDPVSLAAQLAARDEFAVVKSHTPSAALRLMASLGRLPAVLCVREPLDCIASLMDQFGEGFDQALLDITASAEASMAMMEAISPLLLRYEAPDARGSDAVSAIARRMGIDLSGSQAFQIADRYEPAKVRAHVEGLTAAGVFTDAPPREQFEADTHWHPRHVGSGEVGRHARVLTSTQAALAAFELRPFRERLGYAEASPPRLSSGSRLTFAAEGLAHCRSGFCRPEGWGVWTEGEEARIILPLAESAGRVQLTFVCRLAPVFSTDSKARVQAYVNGSLTAEILASDGLPAQMTVALSFDAAGFDEVAVLFRFQGLTEVDPRRLGLGLVSLDLRYGAA